MTAFCAILGAGYLGWFRARLSRAGWFFSGLILLLATLASPLDALAREYLLAADALVRVVVWLVVPFLMLEGLPPSEGGAPHGAKNAAVWVGWIAGMPLVLMWYLPDLYNAALAWEPLRWAQWAAVLVCGLLFWLPLTAPRPSWRVKPVPAGIWYLFGATMCCSIAGLALAFTGPGFYHAYNQTQDRLKIADFLRNELEMTRAGDQETAGLLLWLGTSAVLLSGVMLMFYRWYVSREVREEFTPARSATLKR